METPIIKEVALNLTHWELAYTIIRINDVSNDQDHIRLIQRADFARRAGRMVDSEQDKVVVHFSTDERIRIKSYVFTFCENLSINLSKAHQEQHPLMAKLYEDEALRIYKMAMAIMKSFSTI